MPQTKVVQVLTFFLLFLVPFIIAPFGVTQFENPKVIVSEAAIILIFLITLFSNKLTFFQSKKQIIIYGSIFAITLVHLLFFLTEYTFFGNAFRMQGIFLLWMLLLFSFLSSNVKFDKVPWWVFSLLLIIETVLIFFLPLNESQRYVGTLGEPNALSTFAIFVWPFGYFAIKEKRLFQIVWKALIILSMVAAILYLSGSRSGMIAFGVQILFLVLLNRRFAIKKATLICIFAIAASLTLPYFIQTEYENRVEVWKSAGTAGKFSPIFGNGFGNMDVVLHKAAEKVDLPIQYYYFDSSHNIFLDWWVQGGFVGLVLITALTYHTLESFVARKENRELVLFLGLLTSLSFNPASVAGLLSFWWLVGRGFERKIAI